MENPGEYLRRERELRGVSIEEISGVLKLSMKTIEALEKDAYGRLPHPTYVRGFIRSYCGYLGLDENDALLRFEAYLKEEAKKDKDKDRDKDKEKERDKKPSSLLIEKADEPAMWTRPNKAIVLSLVLSGIFIIALYFIISGRTARETVSPAGLTPAIPSESAKPRTETGKDTSSNAPLKTADRTLSGQSAVLDGKVLEKTLPGLPGEKTAKKLSLDIYAKGTTWIKAEIDGKERTEVLLRKGDRISWKAGEVFF
ncbi:MAG: helix-turn-helix domain-containing protein [Deltaproteobacteria bacterium]|nr:helix-turn-helix domain-containing protein [Deltaproteobacteria bacterium]